MMRAMIGLELVRKLPARDLDIRDTKLMGFVLRCRATGRHSYRVQLSRGRWLTIGPVGTLTPPEAREAARQAIVDVANGIDPMAEHRRGANTWSAFVTDVYGPWVTENRKTGSGTLERLKSRFAEFDSLPLSDLSAFAVERWRTARLKAGAKPATVNRDLAAIRSALTKAIEWKLITLHPLATVKAARVDKIGHVRFLSSAEEKRLRAALEARDERRRVARMKANEWRREREYPEWPEYGRYTDHLTPLVLLAKNTGCRRGELLQLRWRDIDLKSARLTIRGDGAKSGTTRVVALNVEAVSVLKAWQPRPADADAFVFQNAEGDSLGGIKTAFLKLLQDAKIVGFRFHDLRHDFASKLVQAGVDLNTVRELLGHADLKMTLRYAHLAPEHQAAAVAKLVHA
jgi:integrase